MDKLTCTPEQVEKLGEISKREGPLTVEQYRRGGPGTQPGDLIVGTETRDEIRIAQDGGLWLPDDEGGCWRPVRWHRNMLVPTGADPIPF